MGESRAPYWQTPFFVLAAALGVNLLIVTGSFPGTSLLARQPPMQFQTIVIAFVALAWGRLTPAGIDSMKMKAV